MPPRPPVPSVAKVVIEGTQGGSPWANVFHVLFNTDFLSPSQCNALALGFINAYKTQFQALMNTGVIINTCLVTDLGGPLGNVGSSSAGFTGTKSGTALTGQVAQCVSWSIGRHYRGGHPRTYFPGPVSTDTTNPTTWSASALAAWTSAAQGFLPLVNGISGAGPGPNQLVCVHYVMNKVQLASPLVDIIGSASVDSRIDTQRRRLGKDR